MPNQTVITGQDPFECGFVATRIAWKYNAALHIQIHTDFLNRYFSTSPLQFLRTLIARYVLPRADAIRVVSERIADSIGRTYIRLKQRPMILPIRINIEEIQLAVPDPASNLHSLFPQFKQIIFMASRLSSEKRIQDAFQAYVTMLGSSTLREKNVGIVIAGQGWERAPLEKEVFRLGIVDKVIFLGARNDIPQLLKSADIFLSTSQYEGYGMSIIEAAAAHCPVVSTDAGIASQKDGKGIIKNGVNSLICPVGDTDCLAQSMERLVNSEFERKTLSDRLFADIAQTIPSESEYVDAYIRNIESALHFKLKANHAKK